MLTFLLRNTYNEQIKLTWNYRDVKSVMQVPVIAFYDSEVRLSGVQIQALSLISFVTLKSYVTSLSLFPPV